MKDAKYFLDDGTACQLAIDDDVFDALFYELATTDLPLMSALISPRYALGLSSMGYRVLPLPSVAVGSAVLGSSVQIGGTSYQITQYFGESALGANIGPKSVIPGPPGLNGRDGMLLKSEVTLTSAELGSFTAGHLVQLVPAPGLGKQIVPQYVFALMKAGSSAYSGGASLVVTTAHIQWFNGLPASVVNAVANTYSYYRMVPKNVFQMLGATDSNSPLYLACSAPFTAGNGKLKLVTWYDIFSEP